MNSTGFDQKCRDIIVDLGLGAADDVTNITGLTGGVASDIAMLDVKGKRYCVKCALARLKVAAVWEAPVRRNKAEYRWLEVAGEIDPAIVPKLYGRSETHNGFVMEFLKPDTTYLWKAALLAGEAPGGEAALVAKALVKIHQTSARRGFNRDGFDNQVDFKALRLEPYLYFTAAAHPEIADELNGLADRCNRSDIALVHGDISPKNIMFRSSGPVLLDAECATMGDPAFDVAFCLNHLVLKSIHLPHMASAYLAEAEAFWQNYAQGIDWEPVSECEARVASLLPALMLARVDGKSPVEYLTNQTRQVVRDAAIPLIKVATPNISTVIEAVANRIKNQ